MEKRCKIEAETDNYLGYSCSQEVANYKMKKA